MSLYVYLIGPLDSAPIRIGVSGAPEERLRQFQPGHPEILHILVMFPSGEDDEQALHKIFAAERLRGEWFRRTPRVRKFIDMVACKVGPVTAMAACRPVKEKRQELKAQQRQRETEAHKQARGRAELAKLIANSNGRIQLVDPQNLLCAPHAARQTSQVRDG
jgi:hypothetical protein